MASDRTRYYIFPEDAPGWSSPLFVLACLAALVYRPPSAELSTPAAVAGFALMLGLVATRNVAADDQEGAWFSGTSGALLLIFVLSLALAVGVSLTAEWDAAFDGFLFGGILSLAVYHAVHLLIAREVSGW